MSKKGLAWRPFFGEPRRPPALFGGMSVLCVSVLSCFEGCLGAATNAARLPYRVLQIPQESIVALLKHWMSEFASVFACSSNFSYHHFS